MGFCWVELVLFIILVLVPPAFLHRSASNPPFDDSIRNALVHADPDVIFIGNSALYTRMDLPYLESLAGNHIRTHEISLSGSGPVDWYLWIKNSVIPARIDPKAVFLFTRLEEITRIDTNIFRPDEQFRISRAFVGEEPELHRVLDKHIDFRTRLASVLIRIYPIQLDQGAMNWTLDSLAMISSLPGFLDFQIQKVFGELPGHAELMANLENRRRLKSGLRNDLFAYKNLRIRNEQAWEKMEARREKPDFEERLSRSLLPAIVQEVRENNLNLVFVFLKSRPEMNDDRLSKSPDLRRYELQLMRYLESNGLAFHNFTEDPTIRYDDFIDGIHIKAESKASYTQHFFETFPEYFLSESYTAPN